MPEPRYRVLTVCARPVQYMSPLLRRMAQHPQMELRVAYCSLRGAEAGHDAEFGATVQWDVPLLERYDWQEVPNRGTGEGSFWGMWNPGLWKLIREGEFDAVICHTGYKCASFWISLLAAKVSRSAFLFGTDASSLVPRDAKAWKVRVKKWLWPRLFALADQVMVPSNPTRELMLGLGISDERITLTPFTVDNDWWLERSAKVDKNSTRASWGATPDTRVVLYCAKLQPWKRPMDLLRAFAQAGLADSLLVIAGEGPLRGRLAAEAANLGVAERVKFLGFVNQSELPAIYAAADLMVLPSEYEPFAVVVNEAACCGCAVAASDRVGAARDLIAPVNAELIYPCGDLERLTQLLRGSLADPGRLAEMGRAAREHMKSWSPARNISATLEAIRLATKRLGREPHAVASDKVGKEALSR